MEHLLKVRKSSVIEEPVQRIIIGVAGGSAAGKTTLCENINRQMAFDRNFKVQMVSLDSFYKSLGQGVNAAQYNFDHPSALDFDLAYETLKQMKQSNQRVPIPQYSFIQHKRLPEPTYANPANIIFFQGLMVFHDPRIRDLMTYKIFITCDDDIRLCRRLKRDTTQRGRTIQSVLLQYNKFVKDSFRNFILPTMVYADIIIPGFRNNRVSVDFIVQHIKNIARRINYRETAAKTKIYIFGQNELYDFEYRQSHQIAMTLFEQSFLVFPTSQQHRKQLQFFMNRLISQTFSYEYYEQVYICQFIKIQKSLLAQLFLLKEYKLDKIQIFAQHNIEQISKYDLYQTPIKIIFFPVAYSNQAQRLIKLIKQQKAQNPNSIHVILTIFCDLAFPRIIYKLGYSNVILINLFLIANDRRFKQAMENNLISSSVTSVMQKRMDSWIMNDEILTNQGAFIIANDLKLNYISELNLETKKYELAIEKQEKKLTKRTINETEQVVDFFHQKNVYCQEHQNLCGYHTIINILLRVRKDNLLSKQKFIKFYSIFSKMVNNLTFQVLERYQIQFLLRAPYFNGVNVAVFYYGQNYIQNSNEQLHDLQRKTKMFLNFQIQSLYIIMGIFDHFFLLQVQRVSKKDDNIVINLYDSCNISLKDVLNGTDEQYKSELKQNQQKAQEYQSHKKHMKNARQALQCVKMVFKKQKTFRIILVQKRIEQICIPFLSLKNEKEIEQFFRNEYPIPVIDNDLLKQLKKVDQSLLSQKHRKVLQEWRNQPAIKWGILASISK